MFDFGIDGYEPRWLRRRQDIAAEHGARLRGLVGRVLTRGWLVWDHRTDDWFTQCPVLLDFEGEQVEIGHQRARDVSITWNTIDPTRRVTWPDRDDTRLRWRDDIEPELVALHGRTARAVDLIEWPAAPGEDNAGADLAVGFTIGDVDFIIHNGADDNRLGFGGPPTTWYERHRIG